MTAEFFDYCITQRGLLHLYELKLYDSMNVSLCSLECSRSVGLWLSGAIGWFEAGIVALLSIVSFVAIVTAALVVLLLLVGLSIVACCQCCVPRFYRWSTNKAMASAYHTEVAAPRTDEEEDEDEN